MKYRLDEHLLVKVGLLPQSLSAAETLGPVIDRKGFDEALVIFLAGTAAASAEADVTVREGDESDGSDMATISVDGAAVTGAFTQVTTANDNTVYLMRIDLSQRKRYIQIKNAGDTSNAALVAVAVVLGGAVKDKPVTQDETVKNVYAYNG